MADTLQQAKQKSVFAEIGDTGTKKFGGYVTEEFLSQLTGIKGVRMYREMALNHPVVGGVLYLIRSLLRNVDWNVDAADETPECRDAADFVRSCMDDMSSTWTDVLQEIITHLVFGWSVHEVCYGPRSGETLVVDGVDTGWKSRYTDGKIGWRKISLRAQDSLSRWELNDNGDVVAMVQMPPTGNLRTIPLTKCLHFRFASLKDSPEGQSMLRNAVVPYLTQRGLLSTEAIGIERDLAGMPIIKMPAEYMTSTADATQQAIVAEMRAMLKEVRRNEVDGVLIPSDPFPNTSAPMFSFELVTSGGSRQFDTNGIITRYDQRIALSMLADFLMLGSSSAGSFALSSDKTQMFSLALGGVLKAICEVFNRDGIPKLLKLNGMDTEKTPTLTHGDIENISLTEISNFISTLSGAGMPMFPDLALEEYLRKQARLPKPSEIATREVGTGEGDVSATAQAEGSDALAQAQNAQKEPPQEEEV